MSSSVPPFLLTTLSRSVDKARHAFNTLRSIWNSSALSLHNKIRIFNPMSSLSYCMAPKHGEVPSQTPTSCRPLSTDASETSSTSDGQTSCPTPTSGTRVVKAPLKWISEKGNGGGSATHSGSFLQTSPSKPLTGSHKESER